jgi:hypothetical protein
MSLARRFVFIPCDQHPGAPGLMSDPFPPTDLWRAWLSMVKDMNIAIYEPLSGPVTQLIRVWGQIFSQIGFLNIHMGNSANPETEKEILTEFSYGRQLGRILDVLTPIVEEYKYSPFFEDKKSAQDLKEYLYMANKIKIAKEGHTIATLVDAVIDVHQNYPDLLSQEKLTEIVKLLNAHKKRSP